MTFTEAMLKLEVGEDISYRSANGRCTKRGSLTVLRFGRTWIEARIANGTERRITESDWMTVEENLDALFRSGSVRQHLRTRNATYVLSIRGHVLAKEDRAR